jgi:hypothetical protein
VAGPVAAEVDAEVALGAGLAVSVPGGTLVHAASVTAVATTTVAASLAKVRSMSREA